MEKQFIRVSCHCGKRLKAPKSKAGRSLPCPQCGDTLQIPVGQERPEATAKVAAKPDGFLFASVLAAAILVWCGYQWWQLQEIKARLDESGGAAEVEGDSAGGESTAGDSVSDLQSRIEALELKLAVTQVSYPTAEEVQAVSDQLSEDIRLNRQQLNKFAESFNALNANVEGLETRFQALLALLKDATAKKEL